MDKQKNIVGKFYGITLGKELIEFIVYDNYSIECPKANVKEGYLFILKPRFMIISGDKGHYEYRSMECGKPKGKKEDLIAKYVIEDDLLDFLISHRLIRYSEDMAYLYHIDNIGSYDKGEVKHRYKRALKRGPILKKQREGNYNY